MEKGNSKLNGKAEASWEHMRKRADNFKVDTIKKIRTEIDRILKLLETNVSKKMKSNKGGALFPLPSEK